MRPLIDRLILKRDECTTIGRRINALRRRWAKSQRLYWALVKQYEADCRKHCTANAAGQGAAKPYPAPAGSQEVTP